MRLPSIMLVALLVGCGSDRAAGEGAPWRFEPGGEEPEAPIADDAHEGDEEPCVSDADCGEGAHCYHPETCGEAAYCREGYSECSAAPPFIACGCDGVVSSFAAGCPGPHAWEIGALGHWDADGERCDPTAAPPFSFRIRYTVSEEIPTDGAPVLAKISERLESDDAVRVLPADGAFEIEARGDQYASFNLDLLVDADGDGECTAEVDEHFMTHTERQEVDLETFEVDVELGLVEPSEPCLSW